MSRFLPLAAAAVVGGVGGFAAHRATAGPVRLVFLAVGQGDSALYQADGRNVLVDAGPAAQGFDAGKTLVVPRLRDLGVRRLDLVLLTHPDNDHVGGAGSVLAAYPMARLGISAEFRNHPDMRQDLAEWKIPEDRVIWLSGQGRIRFGASELRYFAPTMGEDNDKSLMIHLARGPATAVLTGDAGQESEAMAASEGDWSAQVMKAGHHGSRTSSGDVWLREVRPRFSVVSCGIDNRYGHPHPDVVERLRRAGADVLRTDKSGEITFAPGPQGFELVK